MDSIKFSQPNQNTCIETGLQVTTSQKDSSLNTQPELLSSKLEKNSVLSNSCEITVFRKIQVLELVCKKLQDKNISFTLGGSGLLYFLGLIDQFNDWDLSLYCNEQDAFKIFQELDKENSDTPKISIPEKDPLYTSQYFFKVQFQNVEFDIIGYFGIRTKTQSSFVVPFQISEYRGCIPLAAPEVWMNCYALMGRYFKYELLKKYIETEKKKRGEPTYSKCPRTN